MNGAEGRRFGPTGIYRRLEKIHTDCKQDRKGAECVKDWAEEDCLPSSVSTTDTNAMVLGGAGGGGC
jgi:hypothetical protein